MRARWSGDQNNPNRDLSDPSWVSVEGARAIRRNPKERVDNAYDE